jgi:hypothetical protein
LRPKSAQKIFHPSFPRRVLRASALTPSLPSQPLHHNGTFEGFQVTTVTSGRLLTCRQGREGLSLLGDLLRTLCALCGQDLLVANDH